MHRIRPYITFYFQFKSHVRVTLRETRLLIGNFQFSFIGRMRYVPTIVNCQFIQPLSFLLDLRLQLSMCG